MRYTILIFLMILFLACEKDRPIKGDVFDVGTKIYYSEGGIDMLDSNNISAFKPEEIGFEFQRSEGVVSPWNSFEISKPYIAEGPNGRYFLEIYPSNDKNPTLKPTAWVKVYWPNGQMDKITFGVENPYENVEIATFVEINNALAWPLTDEDLKGQRYIEIER